MMENVLVHYNNWVVLLSFIIATLASYSALNLAGKVSRTTGNSRMAWMIAGSCVMGIGIWSMHFIGMLAMHMNVAMSYDPFITVLSGFFSIAAAFIAFMVTKEKEVSLRRLGVAGFIMGIGISAMHYTGMEAMRSSVQFSYNLALWFISILVAFMASYAALYLFRKFRRSPEFSKWKLYSSLVMAIAICGMHYIGMAGTTFHHHHHLPVQELEATPPLLLISVTITTLFIVIVSLAALFVDRRILERMAYEDQLTGISNRHDLQRYFGEHFNHNSTGSVMIIDLDRFKSINDTLGHEIGDKLLQQLAQKLNEVLEDNQKAFRLGGDEFLITSLQADEEQTIMTAQKLIKTIVSPFYLEHHTLFVTASIGVSLAPQHGTDLSALMRSADTAMYQAKRQGKNRYCLYNAEMAQSQLRKMELEKDLRKALVQQEFEIYYQPKWHAALNKLVGMEALLRWNHPTLGLISPTEFIPIAEETGFIVPITHWLIKEVCEQNKEWQEKKVMNIPVSINMSARVFESQTLHAKLEEALKESGLEPRYLELEITESIALNDKENTIQQLKELQALGVRISMDDFGTGYSSLGYLDEMPINILKIDQSFIQNSSKPTKQAIIGTIISMANHLNIDVVAEGVETKEQNDFLQSTGCQIMQGYYYGKPMPVHLIGDWMEQIYQT
ncbi:putative bifunctional diguanylate cyclase/phosphodiesterase [Bacillus horti]|uniref:Diguanylate cyclase (GGDEF)-like protein n=1 Tax=Caldalkalibacillus horti TaxID=77523 RepID=A0ABT9VVI0_9BACI|nr:bifunctional diguanylate cyclase/phosphodiesterase [Bacillus horti]MDQ0164993.1 diguanylate cyclase (GGDEF)-like protein [Bacillus horti]